MKVYIDIHSHKEPSDREDLIRIKNIDFNEWDFHSSAPNYPFSVGIHPWWIPKLDMANTLTHIEELAKDKNCWAIGETGIDRTAEVNIDIQKEIFIKHIGLAKEFNLNLILHCVKGYSDVLEILKKHPFDGNLIFHDYNGSAETTDQLLNYGAYFSYGKKLFREDTKAFKNFTNVPLDSIFLETDDNPGLSIKDVYKRAASLRKIDRQELADQIQTNLKNCFKKP